MVLQAYDFLELNRQYDCRLQMGGSDQWGNIIGGVELARRVGGVELFGLTAPLLTTASGAKMGKRSEEHTSELQSLMRISYAVFCLKKKTTHEKPDRHST